MCQEATHDELIESLKITLQEALAFNREEALLNAGVHYQDEGFVGLWSDRAEMQDSTAWVKNNRQSEWAVMEPLLIRVSD